PGAARIVNVELDGLICGRGVDRILILPGNEFPLRDFIRTVCGTIGESVDAPGLLIAIVALAVTGAERLAIVAGGDGNEIVGVLSRGQVKQRDTILIGLFDGLTPYQLIAVVAILPKLYGGFGERRAAQR